MSKKDKVVKEFLERIETDPKNIFEQVCKDFKHDRLISQVTIDDPSFEVDARVQYVKEKEALKKNKKYQKMLKTDITLFHGGLQLMLEYNNDEMDFSFVLLNDHIVYNLDHDELELEEEETFGYSMFATTIDLYEHIVEKVSTKVKLLNDQMKTK